MVAPSFNLILTLLLNVSDKIIADISNGESPEEIDLESRARLIRSISQHSQLMQLIHSGENKKTYEQILAQQKIIEEQLEVQKNKLLQELKETRLVGDKIKKYNLHDLR